MRSNACIGRSTRTCGSSRPGVCVGSGRRNRTQEVSYTKWCAILRQLGLEYGDLQFERAPVRAGAAAQRASRHSRQEKSIRFARWANNARIARSNSDRSRQYSRYRSAFRVNLDS